MDSDETLPSNNPDNQIIADTDENTPWPVIPSNSNWKNFDLLEQPRFLNFASDVVRYETIHSGLPEPNKQTRRDSDFIDDEDLNIQDNPPETGNVEENIAETPASVDTHQHPPSFRSSAIPPDPLFNNSDPNWSSTEDRTKQATDKQSNNFRKVYNVLPNVAQQSGEQASSRNCSIEDYFQQDDQGPNSARYMLKSSEALDDSNSNSTMVFNAEIPKAPPGTFSRPHSNQNEVLGNVAKTVTNLKDGKVAGAYPQCLAVEPFNSDEQIPMEVDEPIVQRGESTQNQQVTDLPTGPAEIVIVHNSSHVLGLNTRVSASQYSNNTDGNEFASYEHGLDTHYQDPEAEPFNQSATQIPWPIEVDQQRELTRFESMQRNQVSFQSLHGGSLNAMAGQAPFQMQIGAGRQYQYPETDQLNQSATYTNITHGPLEVDQHRDWARYGNVQHQQESFQSNGGNSNAMTNRENVNVHNFDHTDNFLQQHRQFHQHSNSSSGRDYSKLPSQLTEKRRSSTAPRYSPYSASYKSPYSGRSSNEYSDTLSVVSLDEQKISNSQKGTSTAFFEKPKKGQRMTKDQKRKKSEELLERKREQNRKNTANATERKKLEYSDTEKKFRDLEKFDISDGANAEKEKINMDIINKVVNEYGPATNLNTIMDILELWKTTVYTNSKPMNKKTPKLQTDAAETTMLEMALRATEEKLGQLSDATQSRTRARVDLEQQRLDFVIRIQSIQNHLLN